MEAFLVHGKSDQNPHSTHKSHTISRNPRKIQPPVFQRSPFDDIFPPNIHSMGLLQTPPMFVARSYPPYPLRPPPQPPLLPLPAADVNLRRSYSTPPAANRNTHRSQNPKKSKSPKNEKKKTPTKSPPASSTAATKVPSMGATRPDRKELPNNARNVFRAGPRGGTGFNRKNAENTNGQVEIYIPGSMAYTAASPPPSSLPLPSFCLRQKNSHKLISCNAEAGGVNDGASDSLRQILRLK